MSLKIIRTSDGSHSVYNDEIDETYHSVHGSINESKHVYIDAGLKHIIEKNPKKPITILEIGFGTGLNFLLVYNYIKKNKQPFFYHTLEPNPLPENILKNLNHTTLVGKKTEDIFKTIHHSDEKDISIGENIIFKKSKVSLENISLEKNSFDIIFFDAFAPSKQPEIWSYQNLSKVYKAMKKNAVLVTYCSSSKFKRSLIDTISCYTILSWLVPHHLMCFLNHGQQKH